MQELQKNSCFHCGLPLSSPIKYRVAIDGESRAMCCAGCHAIAETIISAGLADYYQTREVLPNTEKEIATRLLDEISTYDLPDFQKAFVHENNGDIHDAIFLIEGIRCAACVWLIERHIRNLKGIREASVNYATQRMHIKWNDNLIKLSEILIAIASIGYIASPFDEKKATESRRAAQRNALKRLAIAGLCMMQVMMLAIPSYLAGKDEIAADQNQLMQWASLLLTLPVLCFSGQEFFSGAWRDFKNRHLGMDVPIALGISVAFIASTWATIQGNGEIYFDSITMLVFLLLAARFLEQQALWKAGDFLERLGRIVPERCNRLDNYPASRVMHCVFSTEVRVGDCLLVGTGERISVDGVILEGVGENDESLISGESRSINKTVGDMIVAGAINLGNPLIFRATQIGEQSTIAQISRLVDRALSDKPRLARLADRIASIFVLGLLIIVSLAAFYWGIKDLHRTLPIIVALLIITCPCALALATPTVLAAAIYRLVREGLLPTRENTVETLSKVTDVIFDKTGTLTQGGPTIVDITLLGKQSRQEVLAIAAGLELSSKHPLAKPFLIATIQPSSASDLVTQPGGGVEGKIDGVIYRIGTLAFVKGITGSSSPMEPLIKTTNTVVALGNESGWLAFFYFTDALRSESRRVIAELKSMGKNVHILSGDLPAVVTSIATDLGITTAYGNVLPFEKLNYISALQMKGCVVAMIGDGINDAPGLGGADVSIAMGSGTDIAQTTADMVLLRNDISIIPQAFHIAKMARSLMHQNLAWAAIYNLIAIPLAALGFVTPLIAAIGMSASSLIVVANSFRLSLLPIVKPRAIKRDRFRIPARKPV